MTYVKDASKETPSPPGCRRRKARASVRWVAVIALAFPLVASMPAVWAHPKGQRPVLDISRTSSGLDIQWIIAPDDFVAVRSLLQIVFANPLVIEDEQRYIDYVTSKLHVSAESRSCSKTLTGIVQVPTGFSTGIAVTCNGPVSVATVRSELLLDLSDQYVHRYRVLPSEKPLSGTLTAEEPTVSIDFDNMQILAGQEADHRGRLEAFVTGEGDLPLLFALGIAIVLGMVHGLTPGHGKTLTAAYLAGSRGTLAQAALLALVVAIAHGISTLALAAIASGVNFAAPEAIIPWLEGAAALLALGVGIALLRGMVLHRHSHDAKAHSHGSKAHSHGKERSRGKGRNQPQPVGRRGILGLIAIGLVGGIIPGPEAFAVGFLAVALDRLLLGFVLVTAFSFGLALVVFAVASLAVAAGHRLPSGQRAETVARRTGGVVFIGVAALLGMRALPL